MSTSAEFSNVSDGQYSFSNHLKTSLEKITCLTNKQAIVDAANQAADEIYEKNNGIAFRSKCFGMLAGALEGAPEDTNHFRDILQEMMWDASQNEIEEASAPKISLSSTTENPKPAEPAA
jgi:hypothetical protein